MLRSRLRSRLRSADADADADGEGDPDGVGDVVGKAEADTADGVDHLIGEDVKLVLYRVAQEAISNVVRHAEASKLEVLIRLVDSAVVTTVTDDGKGYEIGDAKGGPGLGLLGMRERAAGVGGWIEYQSTLGEGSTIVLTVPLETPEP